MNTTLYLDNTIIPLGLNDFEMIVYDGLLNFKLVPKDKRIKQVTFIRPSCPRCQAFLLEKKNKPIHIVNVDENKDLACEFVTNILPSIINFK